ncbi:hypothetical protein C0995_004416 [Termitomyces sp. Mi166|nr:hypothetical protein C0995_004416 [Termitomyces sp. Mi166\
MSMFYVLPTGHLITVFGAQKINFTGVTDIQSHENTGYRIDGEIDLTVYRSLEESTSKSFKPKDRDRLQHSNLRPVAPPDCKTNTALPHGTIVALKQDTTYKGVPLPKGELFVIGSDPQTPLGQAFRSRNPIGGALYAVKRVKKEIHKFKVKNSSAVLVMHNSLERVQ